MHNIVDRLLQVLDAVVAERRYDTVCGLELEVQVMVEVDPIGWPLGVPGARYLEVDGAS